MTEIRRYLRPRTRTPHLLVGLTAVAFIVAAGAVFVRTELVQETQRAHANAMRLNSVPKSAPAPGRAEEERNEHWAKLEAERRFNWYPIFLALEAASNEHVELLEFNPDKVNGVLRLRGDARNVEELVAYLGRLGKQPAIRRAYLSQQKNTKRDAIDVVSFEIHAVLHTVR